ncbi:MAG: hemerythrin domain-containing protein [Bacteroidaceae bacterium]|nr:hemerythrin domain-containing protein [Bacteroidaceae bacterium]MBR5764690.1 hemerythrin domain-containing protein [Bacteroidaceae bacterium]
MIQNRKLFAADDKLANVVAEFHDIILVFPRFGINLGFGDRSIAEVCKMYGVDVNLFLMVCNIYSFEDYYPESFLNEQQLKSLIDYLLKSHRYYLDERVGHIANHLMHIANSIEPKFGTILRKFFDDYRAEVVSHFSYEEENVFPYIESLLEGGERGTFCIRQFEENHSNIEDKLDDLINIIVKYLPGDSLPRERTSVLFDLFRLSKDLKKHALIEDYLLAPSVEALEDRRNEE